MKKVIAVLAAVLVTCLFAIPVMAQLALSPATVTVDVPADGSSQLEFTVYDFSGDLEIDLEDIPLTVEPAEISVTAGAEGSKVVVTLHGDETLSAQTYEGFIRFLARTGGMVAMGIKVRATVNHTTDQEPPPSEGEDPPPATPTELPILQLAGIAAGTAITIALIVVLARRRRA